MIDELVVHPRVFDDVLSLKCSVLDITLKFERKHSYGVSLTLNGAGNIQFDGNIVVGTHQIATQAPPPEPTLIELAYDAGTHGYDVLRVVTDTLSVAPNGLAWCFGEPVKLAKLTRVLTAASEEAAEKDEEERQRRLEQEQLNALHAQMYTEISTNGTCSVGMLARGDAVAWQTNATTAVPALTAPTPVPRRGILRTMASRIAGALK
jgi:hypothetical protein